MASWAPRFGLWWLHGERHKILCQEAIYAFLKEDWKFPSQTATRKQQDFCRLFNEQARKTNEEALTIKSSMSDLLGLYGLLRHFVEARLPADGRIGAEVWYFQMVCKAVDLLVAAKKRRVPVRAAGRQLQALLARTSCSRRRAAWQCAIQYDSIHDDT